MQGVLHGSSSSSQRPHQGGSKTLPELQRRKLRFSQNGHFPRVTMRTSNPVGIQILVAPGRELDPQASPHHVAERWTSDTSKGSWYYEGSPGKPETIGWAA